MIHHKKKTNQSQDTKLTYTFPYASSASPQITTFVIVTNTPNTSKKLARANPATSNGLGVGREIRIRLIMTIGEVSRTFVLIEALSDSSWALGLVADGRVWPHNSRPTLPFLLPGLTRVEYTMEKMCTYRFIRSKGSKSIVKLNS